MAGGLSHTAKHAVGIEVIHPSQHAAYLRARSAVYRPERSSKEAQVFWSAPSRRWLKVYSGTYQGKAGVVVEFHPTCPCSLVG